MRRLHARRLAPPLAPLAWLLALAVLGALGLRWTLPPPAPALPRPAPSHQPLQQAASAAPAPRHVTRSLSELGLGPLAAGSGPGLPGLPGPRGLSDFALLLGRVPQAGAELLALLLRRLQPANGFRLRQLALPPPQQGRPLSPTEQEELVVHVTEVLRREALPVAFHGDVFFTNFSIFDRQSPIFVSMVRDPVERAMAGFHHSSATRKRRRAAATANGLRVDGDVLDALERCGPELSGRWPAECSWAQPQAPYFCGHEKACRLDSDWALRRAKANIDHYFPVVGVVEELNATMAVLEKRIPLFFTDMQEMYRHQLHEPHINWNKKKDFSLSPLVRRKIKKRLALEYELYLWAKQRLMMQQFEDSQKRPAPDKAGQYRIIHTIHKRAHPVQTVYQKD